MASRGPSINARYHVADRLGELPRDRDSETYPLLGGRDSERSECCPAVPARWGLTLLAFAGFFFLYALRFDLSVAVVAMAGNVTALEYHGRNVTVSTSVDYFY